MFKRKLTTHILTLACLFSTGYTFTDETAQETTLVDYVSHQFRISLFGIEKNAPIETSSAPKPFWEELKKQLDPQIKTLSPREVQEVAFNLTSLNSSFEEAIIDRSFVDKLEIISGGENAQAHLFGRIFNEHINTAMGRAYTSLTLCHPIADIKTLHNRQNAIAQLTNNKQYTEKINTALSNIKDLETRALEPWHTKPLIKAERIGTYYFNETYTFFNSLIKWRNTNTILLNRSISKYLSPISNALCALSIPAAALYHFTKQTETAQMFNSFPIQNKIGSIAAAALYQYILISMAQVGIMAQQTEMDMLKHIQEGLMAFASNMNELRKISSLVKKNEQLLKNLPSLKPLADFNDTTKRSAKLNKLLGMLDTNTFTGQASYYTSITGRVLAAYKLVQQVKDELAPIFAAVGELDMYVALAKLYNSREGKEAQYCMVNFVENSATPVIDAQNFWNPFINPDTVVINNVTFDASCPNSILTGPNTGGKSTVIKGIMINVLMAQTFGIAPSLSLTLTPFSKLNCFMNISDDIATGASLFKSEVMRAKKLLDMVQGLQENEFSFVIIDEVFTGTSPQEGEMAALRFAKTLGSYTNNTSIIATHYPKMVNLYEEINGIFHNHHVEILRNEDGSLNRTFKLKNGPSFFNVAFDILEEEGLFV